MHYTIHYAIKSDGEAKSQRRHPRTALIWTDRGMEVAKQIAAAYMANHRLKSDIVSFEVMEFC